NGQEELVESTEAQGSFRGPPWKKVREERPHERELWKSLDTLGAAPDERQRIRIDILVPEAYSTIVASARPRARLFKALQQSLVRMIGHRLGAIERWHRLLGGP